jgi:hypothetical protein
VEGERRDIYQRRHVAFRLEHFVGTCVGLLADFES